MRSRPDFQHGERDEMAERRREAGRRDMSLVVGHRRLGAFLQKMRARLDFLVRLHRLQADKLRPVRSRQTEAARHALADEIRFLGREHAAKADIVGASCAHRVRYG